MRTYICYSLIALSVLGTGGAAYLLKNLPGFAALFALFAVASFGALWHTQGMQITSSEEKA